MPSLSMTGFGQAQKNFGDFEIGVEVRSVNHRYLDISCRLPAAYAQFENQLSSLIKEQLRRGHVDLTVYRTEARSQQVRLEFNQEVFETYAEAYRQAYRAGGLTSGNAKTSALSETAILAILQRREVLEATQRVTKPEKEYSKLEALVRSALKDLVRMRIQEGRALEQEILKLLKHFEDRAKKIGQIAARSSKTFYDKLRGRLESLDSSIQFDPARLAQEIAIIADRTDITEELARLKSHIAQFRQLLRDGENGRKLDFLIQEMGREINTAGNKAQRGEVSQLVVDAKATMEKIREQVQNIE